jgi:HK97 family phage prohead protease
MNVLKRAFNALYETRDEGANGIVSGRPIILNSVTDLGCFREVIDTRALDGADLTDVRLCLNHDTSYVYARSRNNNPNSTMQISTDSDGLTFTASLALEESPRARDFYTAIKRGDIDKMSFMFSMEDYEWEDLDSDSPIRKITKIGKVFEISAVTFPAYQSTAIEARDATTLDSVKRELENLRASRLSASLDSDIELAKAKYDYYRRVSK